MNGVLVRDQETGAEFPAKARIVINAAGPFCDEIRRLDDPSIEPMLAASQGSHVVLDRTFLPGESASLIPETPDGRVLFAIPWHGHTLVGTTDVAIPAAPVEPRATPEEIDFILETAGRYLARRPTRDNVLSNFAGIRPLVKVGGGNTSQISRDYALRDDQPGLLTITGGKWTTYPRWPRHASIARRQLQGFRAGIARLRDLYIHGYDARASGPLAVYGSDAREIQRIMDANLRWLPRFMPTCPTPVPKSSGPLGPRWRERSKMFSHVEREALLERAAPHWRWRRVSPNCWRVSLVGLRNGSIINSARSRLSRIPSHTDITPFARNAPVAPPISGPTTGTQA